jgi:hypothetical protein
MSEEKELLRGKTMSIFNKQPIVLTDKHLIIGERSIELDSILEVYAEQRRLDSKMVVRLKNGETQECRICPEKNVSALTFFGGSIGDTESEMRAHSKATTDRWVNLVNRLLK